MDDERRCWWLTLPITVLCIAIGWLTIENALTIVGITHLLVSNFALASVYFGTWTKVVLQNMEHGPATVRLLSTFQLVLALLSSVNAILIFVCPFPGRETESKITGVIDCVSVGFFWLQSRVLWRLQRNELVETPVTPFLG